jgi:DNA-directed RNA polymerase specialized sigma24 family protein
VSLDAYAEGEGYAPRSSAEEAPEVLEREEARAVVDEALRRLEEEDAPGAALLRARHFDGLSYEDASILFGGASVPALQARAHRARLALRRILEAMDRKRRRRTGGADERPPNETRSR